jgi:hypothetical protein
MSTKDEALKLAIQSLESCSGVSHWPAICATIVAIKQALAEPAQEPVATGDTLFRQFMDEAEKAGVTHWPTPPAAQPAPVQLDPKDWTPCMKLPVVVHVRQQRPGEVHVSTREGITPVKPDDLIMRGVSGEEYPIGRAIFEQTYTLDTTPPAAQRQWVGLSQEEIESCYGGEIDDFAQAIETKLKEKNNG